MYMNDALEGLALQALPIINIPMRTFHTFHTFHTSPHLPHLLN